MSMSARFVKQKMISEYWDTCLFIAYLKNSADERPNVEAVDALIRSAQPPARDRLIVVSTMVLAELRMRPFYDEGHYRIVRDIFYTNRSYMRVVSLNPRLADLASTIGGQHTALTPPDTVHIATALSERVDALLTLDGLHEHGRRRKRDLLQYDGQIGSPPLAIRPPTIPRDTQIKMPEST